MKKFTFMAAFAALALSASAQYTASTPYADASVVAGQTQIFDVVLGADDVMTGLKNAGQQVNDWRPTNLEGVRPLYFWDETFVEGDGSYPGVGYSDFQYDGYPSLNINVNVTWSGAGFAFKEGSGANTEHWTDATKFHVAYRTASTGPASVAFIIADGDETGSSPAKVAVGTAFNDGGAIYPTIGPAFNDEWQAVDISFGDLKKLYPTFNYVHVDDWQGNMVSILGGAVAGQNVSIDCMYFHTPAGDNAVEGVEADAQLVVSANTVNSSAAGIELYDLEGRLVKKTNGTVLGIDDLKGVFVVKAGNAVKKIVK